MSDAVYRRSGRGGAGNFYSQKDIDEAAKRKSQDLEAQTPQTRADDEPLADPADGPAQPAATPTVSSASNGARTYARAGRGGAGNFVDVPSSSEVATVTVAAPSSTPTAQDQAHIQPPRHSGRGGAGNWTSEHAGAEPYDQEQERKRREALDAHILQDIRDSLPQPPKIHYMHGPGRGRKPDLPAV
ncbi:uncharacterized protein F4812DRAFT_422826 [Daldinia caldariorum]|uniref:uncharacterized protein n=1 Tax=Daldinia caldariorum TaxID=326644 RepID=UPI0020076EB8|nr:uncharacterized protein F4812DRAFT_422826 [Daldinia caldariorum]KAI1469364.1 hypothetical protein F4812DRAFT_422826 [Daldinia caldariorum]